MSEEFAETLNNIKESCQLILSRFQGIRSAEDFVRNAEAQILLDAIAMRLQIIGENVKGLGKLDPEFFNTHSGINWKGIMRLRDIISHHYDVIDHEIIFDLCSKRVPELLRFIETLK